MSSSSSPSRSRGERARTFDGEAKRMCWAKAETVHGRHPERWRKDSAGNILCKRLFNCQGCLCFEYDHIIPFSKGGESIVENCQILQTRVNRLKANKDEIDISQLKGYSCDIKFTAVTYFCTYHKTWAKQIRSSMLLKWLFMGMLFDLETNAVVEL